MTGSKSLTTKVTDTPRRITCAKRSNQSFPTACASGLRNRVRRSKTRNDPCNDERACSTARSNAGHASSAVIRTSNSGAESGCMARTGSDTSFPSA